MNRRDFLRVSGAAAVAGSQAQIPFAQAAADPPAPREFAFASPPVLANPSPTGVTIVCAVNAPGTGWVEYGPTETLGQKAEGSVAGLLPHSERVFSIPITGLEPGKKYFYRVHGCGVDFKSAYSIKRGPELTSALGTFRTLDPTAPAAHFTVWNDTHQTTTTLKSLIASLRAEPTDFLMWNGDITNDISDETRIVNEYLNPAGLPYADATPMFLGRGNHDVRGKSARSLPSYIPGPAGDYFYSFRQGPAAFLVMDTGEDKPDDSPAYAGLNRFAEYRSMQQAWLEKEIERPDFKSAPFRIAFLHIPLVWEADVPADWYRTYGKTVKGWVCDDGRDKWHDLLVKAKVDVIISGHTHKHAWFPPKDGRPYAQLIGGGPKPEDATVITGTADGNRLELLMRKLGGDLLLKEQIPRRA